MGMEEQRWAIRRYGDREAFKEEELGPGKFLHLNWDPGRENGVVAKNT